MKRVFIGGYMHSGTSLLHRLLSKHTSVHSILPETKYFEFMDVISDEYDLTKEDSKNEYIDFCKYVYEYGVPNTKRTKKQFAEWKRENNNQEFTSTKNSLTDVFLEFLDYKSTEANCDYWVEKTPSNLYFIDNIINKSPSAKIILVIRDGRDVIASKKKRVQTVSADRFGERNVSYKKLEKKYNTLVDAISWNSAAKTCSSAAEKSIDNIYLIRYEDLVEYPEDTMTRIFSFIGLDYQSQCLDVKFSNPADINHRKEGIYNNSGTFRKILTKGEVIISQKVMRKLLNKFDYKIDLDFTLLERVQSLKYYLLVVPGIVDRLISRYRLLGTKTFISYLSNTIKNKL